MSKIKIGSISELTNFMLYRDAAKLHNLLNTSVSEVTKWANANKLPLDIYKMKMLIVTDEKHLSSKMCYSF